jgi:uncharacterized integral membrane protein (TIGR00697 family)
MTRYFEVIVGFFVAVVLISNVASTKIVYMRWFTFDGGTILFPLAYIFGDIFTEVYGYARSRVAIWTGFAGAALMSLVFAVVGALPPASGWEHQQAYDAILGQTPRIVLASLVAFFAGEFSNSYVLARMKILTGGRWLWTRTIGSTIVGELVDTILFCVIAFLGNLPLALLWSIILSNYVFKVGVEVIFTPVTYRIVARLKSAEQMDVFDIGTDFNPFRLRLAAPGGLS